MDSSSAPQHQHTLRERNKTRRRAAILTAAFELFAERGYADTTIADIADRAEVAPRTVTGYFPTKQDLVMAGAQDSAARLRDAVHNRPDGASIIATMSNWLRQELLDLGDDQFALIQRVYTKNPEINALQSFTMELAFQEHSALLAQELGLDADDHRAHIAISATWGAFRYISAAIPSSQIDEALEEAVQFVTSGLLRFRKSTVE